jgi:hypothetical protein
MASEGIIPEVRSPIDPMIGSFWDLSGIRVRVVDNNLPDRVDSLLEGNFYGLYYCFPNTSFL